VRVAQTSSRAGGDEEEVEAQDVARVNLGHASDLHDTCSERHRFRGNRATQPAGDLQQLLEYELVVGGPASAGWIMFFEPAIVNVPNRRAEHGSGGAGPTSRPRMQPQS
jgi:hypothetical protein